MAWPSALAFDFRSDRAIHGSLDFSCARTYFRLEKWSSSEGRHSSSGHTLGEISLFFFFFTHLGFPGSQDGASHQPLSWSAWGHPGEHTAQCPVPQDSDRGFTRSRSPSQRSLGIRKALPTHQNLESYVKRLEKTYRQDISDLRNYLGSRMLSRDWTLQPLNLMIARVFCRSISLIYSRFFTTKMI